MVNIISVMGAWFDNYWSWKVKTYFTSFVLWAQKLVGNSLKQITMGAILFLNGSLHMPKCTKNCKFIIAFHIVYYLLYQFIYLFIYSFIILYGLLCSFYLEMVSIFLWVCEGYPMVTERNGLANFKHCSVELINWSLGDENVIFKLIHPFKTHIKYIHLEQLL